MTKTIQAPRLREGMEVEVLGQFFAGRVGVIEHFRHNGYPLVRFADGRYTLPAPAKIRPVAKQD